MHCTIQVSTVLKKKRKKNDEKNIEEIIVPAVLELRKVNHIGTSRKYSNRGQIKKISRLIMAFIVK